MSFLDRLKVFVIILNISLAALSFIFAAIGRYGSVLLTWGIIGLTTIPYKKE